MSFLRDDDFFLLMDYQTVDDVLMDSDDLKAFYDAGIHTSVMFTNHWRTLEPVRGKRDWSSIDRYLERVQRHGYKALIACYVDGPRWLPAEWCACTINGPQAGVISPWNADAVEYQLSLYQEMRDRYTRPGECMVYNSWITNGETMFLNEPAWYDPCALASFREYSDDKTAMPVPGDPKTDDWIRDSYLHLLLEQQKILVDNPDREVWLALQPVLHQIFCNGTRWTAEYLLAMTNLLQPVTINHIYYTWIQWSGWFEYFALLRDLYHENQFGGAEYCEGLEITTPAAIQQRTRGQIIGPLHPYSKHAHYEPWMGEKIRWAMDQWRQSK